MESRAGLANKIMSPIDLVVSVVFILKLAIFIWAGNTHFHEIPWLETILNQVQTYFPVKAVTREHMKQIPPTL